VHVLIISRKKVNACLSEHESPRTKKKAFLKALSTGFQFTFHLLKLKKGVYSLERHGAVRMPAVPSVGHSTGDHIVSCSDETGKFNRN
jgi:hypothetical protein